MIKPHHWPQIEFFSSGGQESWHLLCSATAFQRGHSSAPRINACHPLCSVMKQIRLRCFEVSLFPVCNRGVILSICEITSYSPEVIKFSYPSSRSLVQLDRWRRHLASMWSCVPQGLWASGPHLCVEQDYSPDGFFTLITGIRWESRCLSALRI